MVTLSEATEKVIWHTSFCMHEMHLESVENAIENCIRKIFETSDNKDEILICEAMILGAIKLRKIQLDSQSMGGISQVVANDLHKMD